MEFELLNSPLEGLENLPASTRLRPFLSLSLSLRHATTQLLSGSSENLSPKASVRCYGDSQRNLRRGGVGVGWGSGAGRRAGVGGVGEV